MSFQVFLIKYRKRSHCGDFNIDLLKIHEKRLYSEYFDNLLSEGFHPKISLPTRRERLVTR